jgi:hypothetical protein
MPRSHTRPRPAVPRPAAPIDGTEPFPTAEDAWFWFIQAWTARHDGARIVAGAGAVPRPCEPIDVLRTLERLYRQRRLLRDHVAVLGHYGRRLLPPDPAHGAEARADALWREALDRLGMALKDKGIVA